MPDVPFREAEEVDEEFAAKLVKLRDKLDDATRVTLTGDPRGRIRRKVLFLVVAVALLVTGNTSVIDVVVGAIGLFALLALAMTDSVVELD